MKGRIKKYLLGIFLSLTIAFVFSACADNSSDENRTTEESSTVEDTEESSTVEDTEENNTEEVIYENDKNIEDTYFVELIIDRNESTKIDSTGGLTDEEIETLKKIPNSSVTYVSVDGLGNACGMGAHFQQYSVGVCAEPKPGYRYAGCESDTIEFYEYDPNEFLGYDVPWFKVPESGEHVIYVYYEPIE